MAGWINSTQQKRDHSGQRDICAADGRPGTADDPLVKATDGFRVHLSILAWALGFLALAHPALVPLILDIALTAAAAVLGLALANLSFTLTTVSVLLVLRAFPGISRWLGRAWVASVAAVAPVKA